MTVTYIGLGSNLDFPIQHITTAIKALGEIQSTVMLSSSSLYKSKPVGPQDQDDYINAVVKLDTQLSPLDLLDSLQSIENEHGRKRQQRWGPRTLDLDILIFGDELINNKRLTVPHPELINRAFMLVPLSEVDADCIVPGKGPVNELLNTLEQSDLEKLA